MKLRTLMFVIPNLFTVTSIFLGFYAMTLVAVDGPDPSTQLYQAALAIFFAIFFDGFDGRVARLTHTQSLFGQEFDSLADVMTFGAAPALLVWKWALEPLGLGGAVGAFLFAACGALRLARFNVLAIRSKVGAAQFFVGMPIPFAAAGIVSMVLALHPVFDGDIPEWLRWPIWAVVVFLGLLMVSTVRYRTFKDLKASPRAAMVLGATLLVGIVLATQVYPAWVLGGYFTLYLVSGFVESALMLRRHIRERRTTSLADVVDEDDDVEGTGNIDEKEYL